MKLPSVRLVAPRTADQAANVWSIRWKLMLPYSLLTVVFAIGAGYGFTQLFNSSAEGRIEQELNQSSASALSVADRDLQEQLATVRTISYSRGIPEAVIAGDSAALAALIRPVALTAKPERIEVVDQFNRLIYSGQATSPERADYAPIEGTPDYSTLSFLDDFYNRDVQSDSNTGQELVTQAHVVATPAGAVLYVAGPITGVDGNVVGVVLVGTNLSTLLADARAAAKRDVTIYDGTGTALASTVAAGAPEAIPQLSAVPAVANEGSSPSPRSTVLGREYEFRFNDLRFGDTVVGRITVAAGLSSLQNSTATAQLRVTAVFALLAMAALILSWFLGRRLTRPLQRLMQVATAMAEGDLGARCEMEEGDEISTVGSTLDQMAGRLQRQHLATIGSLASAVDARDPYTAGHSARVGGLSGELGRELGLAPGALYHLQIGGLLHDIGKIGVRDHILLKRGALTPEERRLIEDHPTIGLNILSGAGLPRDVLAIVGGHHERLDGTGYPLRLSADELTIFPRIASVADVYDALTTDRPYRAAMTVDEAMDLLRREAGAGLIDGDVVSALQRIAWEWQSYLATTNGAQLSGRDLARLNGAA